MTYSGLWAILKAMRSLIRKDTYELPWTDEELEDPDIQKKALNGIRKWQCSDCKTETLSNAKPLGCIHYYRFSSFVSVIQPAPGSNSNNKN